MVIGYISFQVCKGIEKTFAIGNILTNRPIRFDKSLYTPFEIARKVENAGSGFDAKNALATRQKRKPGIATETVFPTTGNIEFEVFVAHTADNFIPNLTLFVTKPSKLQWLQRTSITDINTSSPCVLTLEKLATQCGGHITGQHLLETDIGTYNVAGVNFFPFARWKAGQNKIKPHLTDH